MKISTFPHKRKLTCVLVRGETGGKICFMRYCMSCTALKKVVCLSQYSLRSGLVRFFGCESAED